MGIMGIGPYGKGGGGGSGGGGDSSQTPIRAYNASTNTPDLDTSPSGIVIGDRYMVTVAGTFFTEAVAVNTLITALQDDPTLLEHWSRVPALNVDGKANTSLNNLTATALSDLDLRTETQIDSAISTATSGKASKNGNDIEKTSFLMALNVEEGADVTDAENVKNAGGVVGADTDISSAGFVLNEDDFSSNSDTKLATQRSIKTYADAIDTALKSLFAGAFRDQGAISSTAGLPGSGILKGHFFRVSVDFTFIGESVVTGDAVVALKDTPSSSVLADWFIFHNTTSGGGGGITGAFVDEGAISSTAGLPSSGILKGHFFRVDADFTFIGTSVVDGDAVVALIDSPSSTDLTNWFVFHNTASGGGGGGGTPDDASVTAAKLDVSTPAKITEFITALGILSASSINSSLGGKASTELSNLSSAATARTNLGVDSSTQVTSKVSALETTINTSLAGKADRTLSNLSNAGTARTNLSVDSSAEVTSKISSATTSKADTELSNLSNAATARTNLSVDSSTEVTSKVSALETSVDSSLDDKADRTLSNLSNAGTARTNLSVDSSTEVTSKISSAVDLKLNKDGTGITTAEVDTLVNALEVRRRFVEQRTFDDEISGYSGVGVEVDVKYINQDLQVGVGSFTHEDSTGILTCTSAGYFNFRFKVSFTGTTVNRVFISTFFKVKKVTDSVFAAIDESRSTDYSRVPFISAADGTPMASTVSEHIFLMAVGDQIKFTSTIVAGSATNNAVVKPSGSSLQITGV